MGGPTFEWYPAKARLNSTKHGVTFEEAVSAFGDGLAQIHSDPVHSEKEEREILVGHSIRGRLLVVAFTRRGVTIRIISARLTTRRERRAYEER